jgi:hypothetical protein
MQIITWCSALADFKRRTMNLVNNFFRSAKAEHHVMIWDLFVQIFLSKLKRKLIVDLFLPQDEKR